ncbi:hypothetical protein RKD26_000002 [Streptomyces calvus]|uniref:hypothetical protein n=1 Tax=Streptomyces calvus TaxID=67282 RepID=UPI003513B557
MHVAGCGDADERPAWSSAVPSAPTDDVPAAPVAPVAMPAPRPAAVVPAAELEFVDVNVDQDLALEDLTRKQRLDWRNAPPPFDLAAMCRFGVSGWVSVTAHQSWVFSMVGC